MLEVNQRTREILLDYRNKVSCQSNNTRIIIVTLSHSVYLRINGVCHRYEIRMKQLKKKMNKDIDW